MLRSNRAALIGGAAALVAIGLPAAAQAVTSAAQADEPGATSLVETFEYPAAAQILADQKIKLIKGDGHLLLVDCDKPFTGDVGYIRVRSSDTTIGKKGLFCIEMSPTARTGFLSLEVPEAYEIRSDGQSRGTGHDIEATWEVDGVSDTDAVPPGGTLPIGIGADPNSNDATLLELRVDG